MEWLVWTPVVSSSCLAWAYLDTGDPDRATELLDDGPAHAQSQMNQLAHVTRRAIVALAPFW
jgi:hypothetical protein